MADSNGQLTGYDYNSRELLSKITNPFGEVTTIGYDSLGRENYRELANGVIEEREFDALGRQWKLQQRLGSTPLARYTMTYDEVGPNQRQQVQELDGSVTTYLYDRTYQLVNEHRTGTPAYNVTYTYDPAGNRLSQNEDGALTTYTYDEANRLETRLGGAVLTTYTYDENGNLSVENVAGALTTYTWDEENRLTQVALPDNSTETYIYSADGLRQRKVKGLVTTDYLRDGQNVLLETTVDASTGVPGVTQQQYTDYPGEWGGLVSARRVPVAHQDTFGASPFNTVQFNQPPAAVIPPASRFYGFDQSGNTRLLSDGAGAETDSYVYTAFGEEVDSSGSSLNPFRYGGQTGYYRDNADRMYVRARHLSVGAGKWMSSDPIGFEGNDWNLYRYVDNNPINRLDPDGLEGLNIYGGDEGPPASFGFTYEFTRHPGKNLTKPSKREAVDAILRADSLYFWGHGGEKGSLDLNGKDWLNVSTVRWIARTRKKWGLPKMKYVVLDACFSAKTSEAVNAWLEVAESFQGVPDLTWNIERGAGGYGPRFKTSTPIDYDPGKTEYDKKNKKQRKDKKKKR